MEFMKSMDMPILYFFDKIKLTQIYIFSAGHKKDYTKTVFCGLEAWNAVLTSVISSNMQK